MAKSPSEMTQADVEALIAYAKRQRRNASIAGVVTLVLVMVLVSFTSSDKLREYGFFVAFVPAFLVYMYVGTRKPKGP
jgi:hypothetical protein